MFRPSVSVIIVNFNAGTLLSEAALAVLRAGLPVELFVCDNGSNDGSMAYLRARLGRIGGVSGSHSSGHDGRYEINGKTVYLLQNGKNLGFSAANNMALKRASGRYILLLNPDCVVTSRALLEMVQFMDANPGVGMAGCRILNEDGTEQAGCRRQLPTQLSGFLRAFNLGRLLAGKAIDQNQCELPQQPVEVEAISGAFMLLRKEAVEDVGLMDEGYFLHCEDLDYCKRYQDKSWGVFFVPGVDVVHFKGACSASRPVTVEWHKHHGMWRYYQKYLSHDSSVFLRTLFGLGIVSRFIAVAGKKKLRQYLGRIPAGNMPSKLVNENVPGLDCAGPEWPRGVANKRVLVTGSSGMVGQRLVPVLCGVGANVHLLVRDKNKAKHLFPSLPVSLLSGDLTCEDSLRGVCDEVDIVFHLASYPGMPGDLDAENDPIHFDVTVNGTVNLIREAKAAGVHEIIFASSVRASYGEDNDNRYAQAKRQAEQLLLDAGLGSGPSIKVLRFPAIYGSIRQGNIARLISAIDRGRFPPIPEFGNHRSMIHLDDVVCALMKVVGAENLNGRVLTVTDGESYSTRRMYNSIRVALGKSVPTWFLPKSLLVGVARMGDVLSWVLRRPFPISSTVLSKLMSSGVYDGSEFSREASFKPYHNLESALPEMISGYKSGKK